MDKMKEVTKNFFVCGVLMVIAGIALIAVSKKTFGTLSIFCGIIFLVMGVVYLIKDLKNDTKEE